MKKILNISQIYKVRKQYKNKKIVFMSGVFDLFHYGHYIALEEASKKGNLLIVQIDGNKLVKKRKGKLRPFIDEKKRAETISKLPFVSHVFISNSPSENNAKLKKINPHIFIRAILKHENNRDREKREIKILNGLTNTKIVWINQIKNVSSTKFIKKIKKDRLKEEMQVNFDTLGDKTHRLLIKSTKISNIFLPKEFKTNSSSIICYHSVENDSWMFSTKLFDFQKQIEYLNKNYKIVSLENLIKNPKENSIAITFDDGYQNTFENAVPILKKLNIPATFFVLGNPENANRRELENSKKLMTINTIKRIHDLGFEIGFHTNTHSNLKKMTSNELESEIVLGKKDLERKLGFKTKYFAYPRGLYSKKVIDFVKKAKFKAAFTIESGEINTKNKYLIPRYSPDGNISLEDFIASTSSIGLFLDNIYMKALHAKDNFFYLWLSIKNQIEHISKNKKFELNINK